MSTSDTSSTSSRTAHARRASEAVPNHRSAYDSSMRSTEPPGKATYPGRNRLDDPRSSTSTSNPFGAVATDDRRGGLPQTFVHGGILARGRAGYA